MSDGSMVGSYKRGIFSIGLNADDLLADAEKQSRIKCSFSNLNRLTGGGLRIFGGVYDICGLSGSGKTQLCMQLCVDVQAPISIGGLQGKAIFIDTEGSFNLERFKEISGFALQKWKSLTLKCQGLQHGERKDVFDKKSMRIDLSSTKSNSINESFDQMFQSSDDLKTGVFINDNDVDKVVENLTVLRIYDLNELKETLKNILLINNNIILSKSSIKRQKFEPSNTPDEGMNAVQSKVRLIVIDSLSLHLRYNFENNLVKRAECILNLGRMLNKISFFHKIAVVVVTHLTRKPDEFAIKTNTSQKINIGNCSSDIFYHCLGNSWYNVPVMRILLFYLEKKRKSLSLKDSRCNRIISENLSAHFHINNSRHLSQNKHENSGDISMKVESSGNQSYKIDCWNFDNFTNSGTDILRIIKTVKSDDLIEDQDYFEITNEGIVDKNN